MVLARLAAGFLLELLVGGRCKQSKPAISISASSYLGG